jgi:aspartyl-tRNA(Asn)/glutamyl-tRNA(Gln) amidotransferase subunit B
MDDPIEMYLNDVFTVPVNWPACRASRCRRDDANGLPLGLQLIGKAVRRGDGVAGRPRLEQAANSRQTPKIGGEGEHEASSSRATGDWEIVIGMEVHAQVTAQVQSCSPGASTAFGAEPNSQVSLVDAAMPGMLPVINRECVEQAVRTGLGLKAQDQPALGFDRKNYFYPDLPQGYQISQYKQPIVGEGEIEIDCRRRAKQRVGIERLHLEQDAGKSLHDQHPDDDLRRSQPLRRRADGDRLQARHALGRGGRAYLKKLRTILRYLGTCDGNMEKGNLRADVNVSVRKPGEPLGTRCEIKNVNSIRFIGQAIEYEARRQIDLIEDGGAIEQETRLFDPGAGETRSMRSKEEAHDYRYFPDPDLLPLEEAWVKEIEKSLPELPKRRPASCAIGLSAYDAGVLVTERELADYYEDLAKGRTPRRRPTG